jgi:hypothetical protein
MTAWPASVRLISHPKMWPEIFRGAPIRRHAAALLIVAFIPATFCVWLTTDQFQAASVLKWHPGWAQDSTEFACAFLPTWAKGFWIFHVVRSAVAKNVERRHRSVFPVLAAQLRFVGAIGIGACWIVLLAYLEGQVALGRQATSGYRFRIDGSRDFRVGYFVQTAPWEWDNLKLMVWGYFIILPFSLERPHWALGLSGTGRNMSTALRFGICDAAWRPDCGHPGFGLIERARLDHIGTGTSARCRWTPDSPPGPPSITSFASKAAKLWPATLGICGPKGSITARSMIS